MTNYTQTMADSGVDLTTGYAPSTASIAGNWLTSTFGQVNQARKELWAGMGPETRRIMTGGLGAIAAFGISSWALDHVWKSQTGFAQGMKFLIALGLTALVACAAGDYGANHDAKQRLEKMNKETYGAGAAQRRDDSLSAGFERARDNVAAAGAPAAEAENPENYERRNPPPGGAVPKP